MAIICSLELQAAVAKMDTIRPSTPFDHNVCTVEGAVNCFRLHSK